MARPRKTGRVRRIELRLTEDDPLLQELAQEAQLRGVELPHHIHDLLRSRFLIRQGQALHELLWVPGTPTASQSTSSSTPTPNTQNTESATLAAEAWSSLLDPQENEDAA